MDDRRLTSVGRSKLRGYAALVLGIALALLALEGALAFLGFGEKDEEGWRVQGYHRPDEQLIYAPIPGAERTFERDEFVEHVRINSLGLRGDEIRNRAEVDLRVLVLGDSMTFGHGVGEDEAYPKALERALAEGHPEIRVEVINAGVKGYGADQIYRLFTQRLSALAPDVVIYATYVNDIADNLMHPLYELAGGELVPLGAKADPLYRAGVWNERFPAALRKTRTVRWLVRHLAGRRELDRAEAERRIPLEREKIRLQLASLSALGDETGFRLLVVGIPHRAGPADAYAWLMAALPEGVSGVDLNADDSWRDGGSAWFFRTDSHLNAAGHGRVAEALVPHVAPGR